MTVHEKFMAAARAAKADGDNVFEIGDYFVVAGTPFAAGKLLVEHLGPPKKVTTGRALDLLMADVPVEKGGE